ncbi:MAG: hypothetical protein VKO65_02275 [Cyanobacteriota bacterium]|nr:hypothetical protein [Cyanobacteriota bacterium]
MPHWDYRVFHLNVDPGKGGEPSGTAGAPPPFTQSYLEQEFPDHYKHPPTPGKAQPAPPPAKQLQDFLNGLGAEGWSLIGVFPLGPLLMMVLRRRRSEPEPSPQAPAANLENAAPTGRLDSDRLDTVLARLEALEQRLQSTPAAAPPPPPPPPPPVTPAQPTPAPPPTGLTDGSVLPAAALAALGADLAVSTREAAEAIGYRSTASLSNLGNRSGYPAGLVKLGLNGKAAVYRGVGPASSGGKPQRHWLVVPLSRLTG